MTTTTIQNKIARGIVLKQEIARLEAELKDIKSALIDEAEGRTEEHQPTEGGGWSWTCPDTQGNIVRVTQPDRKLKSKVDPQSKLFLQLREIVKGKWPFLFAQVPAYEPLPDFRSLAVAHLGGDSKKVIKLMSTDSSVQVAFEVAQKDAS